MEAQRAEMGSSPSLISPSNILNTTFPKVCLQRVGQAGHQRQIPSIECLFAIPKWHICMHRRHRCQMVFWGEGRGGRGGSSPHLFFFLYIPFAGEPFTTVAGEVFLMPLGFVLQPALLILSGHILYLAGCLPHSEHSYFLGGLFFFSVAF